MAKAPRGRKKKYAEYDELVRFLPKVMTKRPKYINGIGVFRGARGETAWVKINLRNGGTWQGKAYPAGHSLEIKLGALASWNWERLEDRKKELQGKADRGEALQDAPSISFAASADEWLLNAKARVKGYETLDIHVHKHLKPFFADKPINTIGLGDVNRWQSKQLQSAKPGTVKRQFNTLRAIFSDAVKTGRIDRNPCDGIAKIKGIAARQRFLSQEESLKLLEVAETVEPWMADLILWLLHSGMRKGEVKNLLWSDIRELPNDKIVVELRNTKADQGRHVPCTETMVEILKRQRSREKAGDDRVFPYPEITIRRKWNKVRELSGINDVVLHDLRRTNATMAVVGGVDLRTLAARIGHTDLTMLQKHYAALVGSAADEAAEKIEAVFHTSRSAS